MLWLLQWVEQRTRQDRHATLRLVTDASGFNDQQIRDLLEAANYKIGPVGFAYTQPEGRRELTYELWWSARRREYPHPSIVEKLAATPGLVKLDWKP